MSSPPKNSLTGPVVILSECEESSEASHRYRAVEGGLDPSAAASG